MHGVGAVEVRFIAGFGPIVRDAALSQKLYADDLAISFSDVEAERLDSGTGLESADGATRQPWRVGRRAPRILAPRRRAYRFRSAGRGNAILRIMAAVCAHRAFTCRNATPSATLLTLRIT
jgi:hypothetical protein